MRQCGVYAFEDLGLQFIDVHARLWSCRICEHADDTRGSI